MIKRLTIFAGLLAFVCLKPIPGQTPNHESQTNHDAKNQAPGGKAPSKPTITLIEKNCDSDQFKDDADCKFTEGKKHSVAISELPPANVTIQGNPKRDSWDWGVYWANIALAIVGMGGVGVGVATVLFIKAQVLEMRRQRILMAKTLLAIRKQAATMELQAADARGSAAQATALAQQSANAASSNAAAFVNSERAWVQVEVIGDPHWVKDPGGSSKIWFRPLLKNFGRTPATIEFMVVRPHLMLRDAIFPEPPLLPHEPDYAYPESAFTDRHAFLPPAMGIYPLAIAISDTDFEAVKQREKFLYIYGQIFYRDISGEERESRFCNLYWVPPDESHPAPEGFMTTGHTPNAYTECT